MDGKSQALRARDELVSPQQRYLHDTRYAALYNIAKYSAVLRYSHIAHEYLFIIRDALTLYSASHTSILLRPPVRSMDRPPYFF